MAQAIASAILVAGSVLAFGAVEPWSVALLIAIGMVLALLWGTETWRRARESGRGDAPSADSGAEMERDLLRRMRWPALALVALVSLQLVPLPAALVGIGSPGTKELYREILPGYPGKVDWNVYLPDRPAGVPASTDELLALASPAAPAADGRLPPPPRQVPEWLASPLPWWNGLAPLSLDSAATWFAGLRWIVYAAVFLVALRLGRQRPRRLLIAIALGAWGFVMSLFGILQEVASPGAIYGLREGAGGAPYGSFVNRNHFAAYVAMLAPLILFFALYEMRRLGESRRRRSGDLRERLPQLFLAFFALAVVIAALTRSVSRGGFVSLVVALALFVAILYRWRLRPLALVGATAAVVLGLATVLLFTRDRLPEFFGRFETVTSEAAERLRIYESTIEYALRFPLLGSGLGTYPVAITRDKFPTLNYRLLQAHNDYLELWGEIGLAGCLALAALGWIVAKRGWTAARLLHGRDRFFLLALAAALSTMLLHELVDFNLQIPANAVLFCFLAGLLAAVSCDADAAGAADGEGDEDGDEDVAQDSREPNPPAKRPRLFLASAAWGLLAVVAVTACWQAARLYGAHAALARAEELLRSDLGDEGAGAGAGAGRYGVLAQARHELESAERAARCVAPEVTSDVALRLLQRGWGSASKDPAILLLAALRARPANAKDWVRLAKMLWNEGHPEPAGRALEIGLRLDPTNYDYHRFAALFFSETGEAGRARDELVEAYALFPFEELERYPLPPDERTAVKLEALDRHAAYYPESAAEDARTAAALEIATGRPRAARARLEAALRGAPELARYAGGDAISRLRVELGNLEELEQHLEAASRSYDAALQDAGPAQRYAVQLVRARLAGKRHDAETLASALAAAREIEPRATQPYLIEAEAAAARQAWPQARRAYEAAWALAPGDAGLAARLGAIDASEGKLAAALERYRSAIATSPGDAAAYFAAIDVALRLTDYATAAELIAAGLQRFPADPGFRERATRLRGINEEREAELANRGRESAGASDGGAPSR